LSIGATSYKHQKCTSDNQNRGGGLHGRCHDLCDDTSRHPTGLGKDKVCMFEHLNTQRYDGRFVGYVDQHAEQPIFSGNNCTGFQIHEYVSAFRKCHLVEGDRRCQIPDERSVIWGPTSTTINTVCAYLITLQDTTHNTDFPDSDNSRATNLNIDIIVCMVWLDLPRNNIKSLEFQAQC
jgi:hypothetical protein